MDNKFFLVIKILVGSNPTNEPLSCICRCGGMADTSDLKSDEAKPRTSSSLVTGTRVPGDDQKRARGVK